MGTVVTIGKFDALHMGHVKLIEHVTEYAGGCEPVVCIIDFATESLYTVDAKDRLIRGLGVERIIRLPFTDAFARTEAEDFIRDFLVGELKIERLVVGSDFRFGYGRRGDVDMLRRAGDVYGFSVDAVDQVIVDDEPVSSSRVRDCIRNGEVEQAARLLGRVYRVGGSVVGGKQLGRTIGFPTANIIYPADLIRPRLGVYASEVYIDGEVYKGVTNIGTNPTVSDTSDIKFETHIIDFDRGIYGKEIEVGLIKYIRGEVKFRGVDELTAQLKHDKQIACDTHL